MAAHDGHEKVSCTLDVTLFNAIHFSDIGVDLSDSAQAHAETQTGLQRLNMALNHRKSVGQDRVDIRWHMAGGTQVNANERLSDKTNGPFAGEAQPKVSVFPDTKALVKGRVR